jgi:hypothetical protein
MMTWKKHQLPMKELAQRIASLEKAAEKRHVKPPRTAMPRIVVAPFTSDQVPELKDQKWLRDAQAREWFTLDLGTPGRAPAASAHPGSAGAVVKI